MIKMIYILGIFVLNITFISAANLGKQEPVLSLEWIGLILLSFIGLLFIVRSTLQIKKIKKLQEQLNTHQITLSDELDTIGGRNA